MSPTELARLHARAMIDSRPWSAAEFAALAAQPHVHFAADAAALAVGRTVASEAELLTLATLPEARRRGHARRLLSAFEAEARRRGAEVAFLEVAADNAPAISLYRSAGYSAVGRRPAYYRRASTAVDAVVMRKSLCAE